MKVNGKKISDFRQPSLYFPEFHLLSFFLSYMKEIEILGAYIQPMESTVNRSKHYDLHCFAEDLQDIPILQHDQKRWNIACYNTNSEK